MSESVETYLFNPAFVSRVHQRRRAAEQAEQQRLKKLAQVVSIEEHALNAAQKRVERKAAEIAELERVLASKEAELTKQIELLETKADLEARQERRRTRQIFRRIEARAVRVFGVTLADLHDDSRSKKKALPKHFVRYWGKRLAKMSSLEMGRCMGGRDHSSIINSLHQYPKRRAEMGRYLRPVASAERSPS